MDHRYGGQYGIGPTVVHQEQIVEIPQVVYEEKVRHQTRHEVQERVFKVPKFEKLERIEYVDVVEYREVPVDKIIEVPEIEYRVREVEQLVPQTFIQEVFHDRYVEVPVAQIQEVMRKEEVPVFPGRAEVLAKKQAAEKLLQAQEHALAMKQEAQAAKSEAAEARRLIEQLRMELEFVKANAGAGGAFVGASPVMPVSTFVPAHPIAWGIQQQHQQSQQQMQMQMQTQMAMHQPMMVGQQTSMLPAPVPTQVFGQWPGTMSAEEAAAIFDRIDKDHDGCITKQEGEAAMNTVKQMQMDGSLYASYNPAMTSGYGVDQGEARAQTITFGGPFSPPIPPPVTAPWSSMPAQPGAGHVPMGGGSVAVQAF